MNKKDLNSHNTKFIRTAMIDKHIKTLSKIQVDLLKAGMVADDYNELSDRIGDLKNFMANCSSYRSRKGKAVTGEVIKQAMRTVAKDVRAPLVVRKGIVKKQKR